jgi:hypothetical protein
VADPRKRHEEGSLRQGAAVLALAAATGCAPTVDVAGVYFPGWLVSAVTGVFASYAAVIWLGRHPRTRGLADSGLLFLSLLTAIALAVWLVFFSGF